MKRKFYQYRDGKNDRFICQGDFDDFSAWLTHRGHDFEAVMDILDDTIDYDFQPRFDPLTDGQYYFIEGKP